MSLRVEVDELHAAGTQIADAVSPPGGLAGTAVLPAAADEVSVGVASALSVRFGVLATHSAAAGHLSAVAAAVLHANAATYREQEQLNTAALGPGSVAAPRAAAQTAAPAVPSAALPVMPALTPAGITPTDGKTIASLIHGGPGLQPLLDAARQARAHAGELDDISATLRAATGRLSQGWQSPAADAAVERITTLATWYDGHAGHTRLAGRACEAQAEVFAHARSAVPRPEVFEDLERRLLAANRANAASGGLYTPVVTQLQTQLATIHIRAVTAYADYTARAADVGADTSSPPPATVHAVDNHTYKEAPEPPEPNGPNAADIRRVLDKLPIGNKNPKVREVRSAQDLQDLWDWATRHGTEIPSGYGDPSKGTMYQLPDGTIVGQRHVAESNGQPTIDFNVPGSGFTKVHINPSTGGVPDFSTTPPPSETRTPTAPGWGTFVSPEDAAKVDGEIGNLGKAIESYFPPDPHDPNNTA